MDVKDTQEGLKRKIFWMTGNHDLSIVQSLHWLSLFLSWNSRNNKNKSSNENYIKFAY
jgi:hypothetical protein